MGFSMIVSGVGRGLLNGLHGAPAIAADPATLAAFKLFLAVADAETAWRDAGRKVGVYGAPVAVPGSDIAAAQDLVVKAVGYLRDLVASPKTRVADPLAALTQAMSGATAGGYVLPKALTKQEVLAAAKRYKDFLVTLANAPQANFSGQPVGQMVVNGATSLNWGQKVEGWENEYWLRQAIQTMATVARHAVLGEPIMSEGGEYAQRFAQQALAVAQGLATGIDAAKATDLLERVREVKARIRGLLYERPPEPIPGQPSTPGVGPTDPGGWGVPGGGLTPQVKQSEFPFVPVLIVGGGLAAAGLVYWLIASGGKKRAG